ncbi:MAG: CopD family protein, partial [Actinomycetota bacterium]
PRGGRAASFWWLTRGIAGSGMPGFADRLSVEDRWDLINLLRTLAAAEQARQLGPIVSPAASIVAPDFAFTTGLDDDRSLRDSRGRNVVVLVLFRLPDSVERLSQLAAAYPTLRRLGAEIVAIPVGIGGDVYRAIGAQPAMFPIVVNGAAEAAQTYALFHRDLTPAGARHDPGSLGHLELLVDRQGYLRARFLLEDGGGWTDAARLAAEVEQLGRETPRGPAPDEHVH